MAFYNLPVAQYSDSSASSSPSPQSHHYQYHQPTYSLPIQSQFPTFDPPPSRRPRQRAPRQVASSAPIQIAHPYARLLAKKDEVKRRKIWNHALEKFIFNPYEISTVGAPQRRTMYIASLEAHIDQLHRRLEEHKHWLVDPAEVQAFTGLNCKTAKSMASGLQLDASTFKLKLLELERTNSDLQKVLSSFPPNV